MIRTPRRFCLLAGLILMATGWVSRAADSGLETAPAEFESANLLYEKGRYEAAAEAYEAIIAQGLRTAPLLFNAGNAYFKSDQIGRAIACWLQAEALDPRNDRIQINLEFARKSISGGAQPVPLWPAQLRLLTLNEWAAAVLVALWVWFGSMALGAWRPKLRGRLHIPMVLGAILTLLGSVLLLITARDRSATVRAIVVSPEAVVRFGPLKQSQSAFVARDGSEFRMTDFKDEWIRVEDATGRDGWLTEDQVMLLQGGKPLEK